MKFNLAQLWKFNGTKLINKSNFWSSTEAWNLSSEGQFVYIKNSKGDILTIKENNTTIHEKTMLLKNANQLWEKGFIEDCGYFTLKNPQSQKLLTAVSAHGLEIKGKGNLISECVLTSVPSSKKYAKSLSSTFNLN